MTDELHITGALSKLPKELQDKAKSMAKAKGLTLDQLQERLLKCAMYRNMESDLLEPAA